MAMSWIHQRRIFFLLLLVGTVSGMDPGSNSVSGSQLSTLWSQLIKLQEQVEVLQRENVEDKERVVRLEQVTQEFDRRVSLLESVCGSAQMQTEMSGSLMAIGGHTKYNQLSSAEVLNTSCDFPLPYIRWNHMSLTTTDGKTLVCGGADSGLSSSCLQFNSTSKSWGEHYFNPRSWSTRWYSSMIELGLGVYIVGGRWEDKNSSELLAIGSSVWTQGPHIPGRGVYKSCVAKLSDTEFVILGGEHDRTQAIIYNEETGEWREWPRLTVGVKGQSCVGLGDKVLMAGGYTSGNTTITHGETGRTVIFDTKTGSAREVASLKYPRYLAAMVVYKGKVVILGGEDDSKMVRSDGEMWNMDTETWEEADIHLNIGRHSFSLVTMAEEIDCD